ncbi:MAG: cytochrome c maturation protein CcmE [Deltaproteobacteria bacterium]|nr:cytochrome c maturation protein CcmE [Deltaproteobacteria bacterium]
MTVQTTSAIPSGSAAGPPRAAGKSRVLLIVLSVAIVVGGIGLLLSDSSGFEYYKHVDEVAKESAAWQNKRLQLHGYVVPGSIKKRMNHDIQKLEYKFQIENCGAIAEAYFAGVVPDTFKDSAEVVLKGQLHGQQFQANEVMAKCPSKYQQAGGTHPVAVTRCSRDSASKGN